VLIHLRFSISSINKLTFEINSLLAIQFVIRFDAKVKNEKNLGATCIVAIPGDVKSKSTVKDVKQRVHSTLVNRDVKRTTF